MLRDLHIQNFRCFDDLLIEKLGRVNLIVGKNGVGKSTILEALHVYARPRSTELLLELAQRRDEDQNPYRKPHFSLFHQWEGVQDAIRIGSGADEIAVHIKFLPPGMWAPASAAEAEGVEAERLTPMFEATGRAPSRKAVYVGPNSLTGERQAEWWDEVALSALEDDIIASLQLVVPDIDRISLIASKTDPSRVPFVRLKGAAQPFPLKRLGDGVNRLFGIALALVHAKGGLLLMDEIENGIHYSLQEGVWTFILEISRRLDIQVFATTHSWDCVVAFQSASIGCGADEGMLTRLERRGGRIVAIQFDESDLGIAAREQIEVR